MNALTPFSVAHATSLPERLMAATRRFAPMWPLDRFVAVNPFLSLAELDFVDAASHLMRTRGARILPETAMAAVIPTLADTASAAMGRFVIDRVSQWAAGYYDQGQALWQSPWGDLPPYAAWRSETLLDATPEVYGLTGFRKRLRSLPADPLEAAAMIVRELALPDAVLDLYLERLLATVGGWAAWLRHRAWDAGLAGGEDMGGRDLLVIRLVWDYLAAECSNGGASLSAWRHMARIAADAPFTGERSAIAAAEKTLKAREDAWRDGIAAVLAAPTTQPANTTVQAVFCIDVRSESLRRALEEVSSEVETFGFAGFFGLPMAVRPLWQRHEQPRCPPLLRPGILVCEDAGDKQPPLGITAAASALSSDGPTGFSYVESFGLGALSGMVRQALGLKGKRAAPDARRLSVSLPIEQRASLAFNLLTGIGLTEGFAPLVAVIGHEGKSDNNPHAAGLHCGACGGQTGADNARLATLLLNDLDVRAQLVTRGIVIPPATQFVAGVHITSNDEVLLLDTTTIPDSHIRLAAQFTTWLAEAGARNRVLRAPGLGMSGPQKTAFTQRGHDASQVRPEWALAGCAGFLAAPRALTRGKNLGGRVFLHSYDWRRDSDFAVLEQILTGPVVVASWISLQYYASTVDPEVFGAGNKVLHNVCGSLGVLEGNGGDLRTGLPLQSVHDGASFHHEPLRLSVMVAAPRYAIDTLLGRHADLRHLVENRWLHLVAVDDDGRVSGRRTRQGWEAA